MTIYQKTIRGTVLKMRVGFSYPSDPAVTLDTIDFFVEYFCSPIRKVILQKEELLREEEMVDGLLTVNYYAYVDTTITGSGALFMRMHCDIPDFNAPNGLRVEYVEVPTDVIIS